MSTKKTNPVFQKAKLKAESLLNDPEKTKKLIQAAFNKTDSGKYASSFRAVTGKLNALGRMVRCYVKKEYRDISLQTIVLATAALIYFVWPLDVMADIIPLLGFADDAAIILAVFSSISQDIEKFLAWESSKESGAEVIEYTEIDPPKP
ncbi:MAG: DUF1232 domain-containing protein [Chlorobium phaeobacteroides]|jgi:uncharacterized membrane protein YkvA (DUF1232 family)|nr:DUF1232 domain-containing protein [Chlorobium phaeobacteroides]